MDTSTTVGDEATLDELLFKYFAPEHPDRGTVRADPHPFFDRLRRANPYYDSKFGVWLVTGHAECVSVLRDPRLSNDMKNNKVMFASLSEDAAPSTPSTDHPAQRQAESLMLFADAPRHTRLRRIVSRAFTPKSVAQYAQFAADTAADLLSKLGEKDEFDFYNDFAYPVPLLVISKMLDVPTDHMDDFARWSETIVGIAEPGNRENEAYLEIADRNTLQAISFFSGLIEERRQKPGDDLISLLIAAEGDENVEITAEEVTNMCIMLHTAGHELTASSMASGLHLLFQHPDQEEMLRADPSLIPAAFEEIIRFEPPPRASVPRYPLEEIELPDGRTIPTGSMVFAVIPAANRDPAIFDDPHRFDITRSRNPHLGFGQGAHFCIGAPLGRIEAKAAFESYFQCGRRLVPNGDVSWQDSIVVRRLESLPVRWA